MNLPDYFLADLPADADLTPLLVGQSCDSLRQNRARFLASRSTRDLVELISDLAARWLEPDDPFRKRALHEGPAATGFSTATLQQGLDSFFESLTAEALRTLVLQELGHLERLDRFVSSEPELQGRRRSLAAGPELLVHVTAGNLPVPAMMSIVLGLLVRSAQFLKCASGQSYLPRLFAHSLYAIEPKVGSCLEIAEWPGGSLPLEEALFSQAQCVTATGTNETLAQIKTRLPGSTRFLGYGHRVSLGYVTRERLGRSDARQMANAAARDVAAWDQCGCLSPHVYYVETGGSVSPEEFAELLAGELARLEERAPRRRLAVQEAAMIASLRAGFELRAAYAHETRVWQSPASTAWTVVFEQDPRFQFSCLNRFLFVKPTPGLDEAIHACAAIDGQVSTVALGACGERASELANRLAQWGVARVCPPGRMQQPPLGWRHDGRPALADLVTWTDYES
jgi:hypothetical protein